MVTVSPKARYKMDEALCQQITGALHGEQAIRAFAVLVGIEQLSHEESSTLSIPVSHTEEARRKRELYGPAFQKLKDLYLVGVSAHLPAGAPTVIVKGLIRNLIAALERDDILSRAFADTQFQLSKPAF